MQFRDPESLVRAKCAPELRLRGLRGERSVRVSDADRCFNLVSLNGRMQCARGPRVCTDERDEVRHAYFRNPDQCWEMSPGDRVGGLDV